MVRFPPVYGGDPQNAMPERPHAVDDTYPSHMR